MAKKPKILPIDDMTEAGEKAGQAQNHALKEKLKEDKQLEGNIEVKKKNLKEEPAKEEKSKEFPEFELGFDPFADQSK